MNLAKRIEILKGLKNWLSANDSELQSTIQRAYEANKWFTEDFVKYRIHSIINQYLDEEKLNLWIRHYHLDENIEPKKIGVVMAGNIPLVGFHDFLCVFVMGHYAYLKLSEKDQVLFQAIIDKMKSFDAELEKMIVTADMLKGCDAYIATGSNNTSRYFEYYFGKYPSIIRKNKTSIAILAGEETGEELGRLSDDVFLYFGLGCRNVTKIYVPEGYDFVPLLNAFKKYDYLKDHVKFKNNYDYHLTLLIMNDRKYICNDNIVLVNEKEFFSPVSELYYEFYAVSPSKVAQELSNSELVQCIVGKEKVEFGCAQETGLFDYADGVDTMQFLLSV